MRFSRAYRAYTAWRSTRTHQDAEQSRAEQSSSNSSQSRDALHNSRAWRSLVCNESMHELSGTPIHSIDRKQVTGRPTSYNDVLWRHDINTDRQTDWWMDAMWCWFSQLSSTVTARQWRHSPVSCHCQSVTEFVSCCGINMFPLNFTNSHWDSN